MGLGFNDGFKPTDRVEFIHDTPWDIKKVERQTIQSRRYYVTPEGKKYPSVSTVVGHFNKASIMAWRKRVGEEEVVLVELWVRQLLAQVAQAVGRRAHDDEGAEPAER